MKFEDCENEKERLAFISAKTEAYKEAYKAVISLAQTTLKIPILINGGAAIAMLALIGNTWGKNSLITDLAISLLVFSIGVLMVAIGTGLSYLAQYYFLKEDKNTACNYRGSAIGCIIFSYILFMGGAWWAYYTFSALKST